jgi:hypothetical protein
MITQRRVPRIRRCCEKEDEESEGWCGGVAESFDRHLIHRQKGRGELPEAAKRRKAATRVRRRGEVVGGWQLPSYGRLMHTVYKPGRLFHKEPGACREHPVTVLRLMKGVVPPPPLPRLTPTPRS